MDHSFRRSIDAKTRFSYWKMQIAWQSPFKHVLRRHCKWNHDCFGSLVCYNCLHAINNCNFPSMLKHFLRRQLPMESRLFWFPSLLQLFTCYKLGIPIDRVPTSKSCVFCLGIKFLFFPIWPFLGPFLLQGLFSWKVLRFSLVALQTCYVKVWSALKE